MRRAVEGFVPASPREHSSRQRILTELGTLERPFDRDGGLVHVTGSGLLSGRRGTVLLVHKKLGIWVQPGGHVDAGEAPSDAAVREATEETGLAVHHPAGGPCLLHLDVHPAADEHTHLDLRYLLICDDDGDPSPGEGESRQVRWFALDEALGVAGGDGGLGDALERLRAAGSAGLGLGLPGTPGPTRSLRGSARGPMA